MGEAGCCSAAAVLKDWLLLVCILGDVELDIGVSSDCVVEL